MTACTGQIGPWDTREDVLKKYGTGIYIYGAASPPSPNPLQEVLSSRRGAGVAFSYLPADPSRGTTPIYHIPNPIPQISISVTPRRNKDIRLGNQYSINLTGHIVPSGKGTGAVGAIFSAQRKLITVLSSYDLYLHVQTATGSSGVMSFPCVLDNISFGAGTYTNVCEYTATLTSFAAHSGYRSDNLLAEYEGVTSYEDDLFQQYPSGTPHDKLSKALLEDFTEEWSYEYMTDYGMGQLIDSSNQYIDSYDVTEGYYKVTRTINAVGNDVFNRRRQNSSSPRSAWQYALDAARKFTTDTSRSFQNNAMNSGLFPYYFDGNQLERKGTLNYEAFNFETNTNINKSAGSVQLTQSWILLPSGFVEQIGNRSVSLESYSKSSSTELENGYISVNIEGTIKGLSKLGQQTSRQLLNNEGASGKFHNALSTFSVLSNSGNYGYCGFYKRAQAGLQPVLNTQPLSMSVSENRSLGEITYNISYDNRPTNWFRGVLRENIDIQDTYPGDLYTLVNVIGRPTGPVIQYGGGRTEYRRNVTIDLQLGYHSLDFRGGRNRNAVYGKPSVNKAFRDDLQELLKAVSPASEPGIRKYLCDAPQETWNPTTGAYNLQISWVYEISE